MSELLKNYKNKLKYYLNMQRVYPDIDFTEEVSFARVQFEYQFKKDQELKSCK